MSPLLHTSEPQGSQVRELCIFLFNSSGKREGGRAQGPARPVRVPSARTPSGGGHQDGGRPPPAPGAGACRPGTWSSRSCFATHSSCGPEHLTKSSELPFVILRVKPAGLTSGGFSEGFSEGQDETMQVKGSAQGWDESELHRPPLLRGRPVWTDKRPCAPRGMWSCFWGCGAKGSPEPSL